ncbi:MAG: 50S ribosomal protein L29 [Candidatus Kerfeldbacteria bacterium]|nr:50S ribosomal protein L29 [Candidatus Kerfeldbacteria bacterium]
MKHRELSQKPDVELSRMLREQREAVRDLRFRVSAQQHKDVRALRKAKRLVAQILTELKVRTATAAKPTTTASQKTPA